MTKPVLFVDTDFLGNMYGRAVGNTERFFKIMNAYFEQYDVRITDRVYRESTTSPTTYPKDQAVIDWFQSKQITPTVTNVAPGPNAGEASIIDALNNPGSDPVLSNSSIPKYIASDNYIDFVGSGHEGKVRGSAYMAEAAVMEGKLNTLDYKSLSVEGTTHFTGVNEFTDYKQVAINRASNLGIEYSLDSENNFTRQYGTKLVTISEADIFRPSSNYANIGEYFGRSGTDAVNFSNSVAAKATSALQVGGKVLNGFGYALGAVDIMVSSKQAMDQASSGDIEGAFKTFGALEGRLAFGIAGATGGALIGAEAAVVLGGAAIGGPLTFAAAVVGGAALGLVGLVYGDEFGKLVGELAYKSIRELANDYGNDIVEFLDNLEKFSNDLDDFFKDLFDNISDPFNDLLDALFPFVPVDPDTNDVPKSPLILDLNGDGVTLTELGETTTYFDLNNSGQAVLTAWAKDGDGILVRDLNANGNIDNITELFGSQEEDGFTILRALDSDGDGNITVADADWDDLRVWVDANMDGITEGGELKTLSSLEIVSISLTAELPEDLLEISGNQITHVGSYTTSDDNQHVIVDAWFDYNSGITRNVADYDFDIRAAFLPDLRGFGAMKDLHTAMSIDNGPTDSLMQKMIEFRASIPDSASAFSDWEGINEAVEEILFTWAGVENVSPNSRGYYVDAQHLEFYEAFIGREITQYGSPDPRVEYGAQIEAFYNYIKTFYTAQLVGQSVAHNLFAGEVEYNLSTGRLEGDFTLYQDAIDGIEHEAASSADPVPVWTGFAQFLGYVVGLDNLTTTDIAMLDAAVNATNDPTLENWSDVVSRMNIMLGPVIESSSDFASVEAIYDNAINGTSGADVLNGVSGQSNSIYGGSGNDVLTGSTDSDRINGDDGNDTLHGGGGDDYLIGGRGNDTYIYDGGYDTYTEGNSTNGNDQIRVLATTGYTSGNIDDIFRQDDNIVIQFGAGDVLTLDKQFPFSSGRFETIVFEADNSTIDLTNLANLKVYGTTLSERFFGTDIGVAKADVIYAGGGNDRVEAGQGNDIVFGGIGQDNLWGEEGDDILSGDAGDDYIRGGEGNDTLNGGDGNDELYGDAIFDPGYDSNDTYFASNGIDYIEDNSGTNILIFNDNESTDITISRHISGYDRFDLSLTWGGNETRIQQFLDIGGEIQSLQFTDTTIDLTTYTYNVYGVGDIDLSFNANDTFKNSSEIVHASDEADVINAWGGNDVIYGGLGDDVYVFSNGIDEIIDTGGNDKLLSGTYFDWRDTLKMQTYLDPHLLMASFNGLGDLTIGEIGTGNVTKIIGQSTSSTNAVETILFSQYYNRDSLEYSEQDIYGIALDLSGVAGWIFGSDTNVSTENISGTSSDNVIFGHGGDDHIQGLSGNDDIFAGAGEDSVEGGEGNDRLFGGLGVDAIEGGEGNDTIYGEEGDDQLSGGDGDDYIAGGEGADTISGGAGNDTLVAYDFYLENIHNSLEHDASYMETASNILNGGEGDDSLYGSYGDDILHGNDDDDILYGDRGDDVLYGDAGNDILVGGHGASIMTGGNGSDMFALDYFYDYDEETFYIDQIMDFSLAEYDQINLSNAFYGFDPLTSDVADFIQITNSSLDSIITVDLDGTETEWGFEQIAILSGVTGLTDVQSLYEGGILILTDYSNLNAVAYDDQFETNQGEELTGNLFIDNGFGADEDFESDVLYTEAKIFTTSHGNFVTVETDGDFVFTPLSTFYGSDSFTYALLDGHGGADFATAFVEVIESIMNIAPVAQNDIFIGNHGMLISGNVLSDNGSGVDSDSDGNTLSVVETSIVTAQGKTISISSNGGFSYQAATGFVGSDNFSYTLSDGQGGTDTATVNITINAPSGSIIGTAGADVISGNSSADTIFGLTGNDQIDGGDGNDYLYGYDGDDTLIGGNGADNLYGGSGADILSGGDDNDKYHFNESGSAEGDIIEDNGISNADEIRLGILQNLLSYSLGNNNNDLIVHSDRGTFTIKNQFSSDSSDRIESIYLTYNGTSYKITLQGEKFEFQGSNASEILLMPSYGISTSTTHEIYAYGGNDAVTGNSYANKLYGGDGNDILTGNGGNDLLYGEDGNDEIYGDDGADYLYSGLGSDFLSGGNGSDRYYSSTSGWADGDVIEDNGDGIGDAVYIGQQTAPIQFELLSGNSNDLVVVGDHGTFTIKNQFTSDASDRIETLYLTYNGQSYGQTLVSDALTLNGSENADTLTMPAYGVTTTGILTLYAHAGNDTLVGRAYADKLYGGDGNDLLSGLGGNDSLYGEAGNDTLLAGDGTDLLYGGADSDVFVFTTLNTNSDNIGDFSLGQNDKVDISEILQGYDPLTQAITDFVQITNSGSNSLLKVDVDGGGNSFVQIATISGVTGLTDEAALVTSGNLIVT